MKVGLVHNWPGAKNSEFDIIVRVRKILSSWKIETEMIDPLGIILDDETHRTPKQAKSLDLVLNLHYTNPKYLPALSYVVNWNPLAYIIDDPNTQLPIPLKQLNYYVNCIRSHDRVLSASSELVDTYADSARINRVESTFEAKKLYLHTTIAKQGYLPISDAIKKTLKVFYIGVNWEKVSKKEETKQRHQGLFEVLDESNQFEFYGLKTLYGVELWQGIDSYRGELPFDGGKSIIEKSAACGITLVLSSEQHKKSELVSTRIFQACKAGAIIISDRNPFIEKYFGDAIYYFDDQANQASEVANNILEQVRLINANPTLAFQRAKKAQKIFLQHFSLEDELQKICLQAKTDIQALKTKQDQLSNKKISIVFYVRTIDEKVYQQFVDNINRQQHSNIEISIIAEKNTINAISHYLQSSALKCLNNIHYIKLANELPLGKLILELNIATNDYTLIYSAGFTWRKTHLFNLLKQAQKNKADVTHSPLFLEYSSQKQTNDTIDFFIKGSENQQSSLKIEHLQQLDFAGYPLGNLLICNSIFKKILQSTEKKVLAQFDLMAIFIMLLLIDKEQPLHFASTYQISSFLAVANPDFLTIDFDEYQHALDDGWINKQRDRNALCAFMQHIPDVISPVLLETMILNWTEEQEKQNTDINQSFYKKTTKVLLKPPVSPPIVDHTESINHLILLKSKVKVRLSRLPLLLSLVKALYGRLRTTYRFFRS